MAQLTPLAKGLLSVIVIGAIATTAWYFGLKDKFANSSNTPTSEQTKVSNSTPAANQPSGPDDYANITAKNRIRVGVMGDSKPFYFLDNGDRSGFNYEFLKLLTATDAFKASAARMKIDTDLEVDTYADVPKTLLSKNARGDFEVDIAMDGLTFQDEDLAGVVYSTPYIDDFGYALIAAKTTTLKEIKDYSGKKIGVLQGDPDAKAFAQKTFPNSTLIELSDASINGKRIWLSHFIGNGTVDAIVYDYPFGVSELEGTNLQFVISKLPESNLKYKIALRENNPVLLDKLNAAVRSVKSSNAYADLLKKYFLSDKLLQTKIGVDEKTYVVKSGDTLSTIAQQLLGDKLKYTIIETRNNLPNPNLISVGQKLIIPANK